MTKTLSGSGSGTRRSLPEHDPGTIAARPVLTRAMHFERLSIEQGLSQSVVNCVLQDSTGNP